MYQQFNSNLENAHREKLGVMQTYFNFLNGPTRMRENLPLKIIKYRLEVLHLLYS